jgi:hypothetical protein
MGVIGFVTGTPEAIRATVDDVKRDGPIVGIAVDGTKRLWGRLVNGVKTLGQDVRR